MSNMKGGEFMKNKSNTKIILIVAVLVAGASGFFGGMQYTKSQAVAQNDSRFQGMNQQSMQPGQNGPQRMGGRSGVQPVSGEIINKDATGVTVKLQDGSTKIILVTEETRVNKTSEASSADIITGEHVTVIGDTNSDGSITAQNVSLGNTMFGGMRENMQGQPMPQGQAPDMQ